MRKESKILILVIVLVFAAMLCFNFLTPMVSDDFAHYYGMTGEHCTGIAQIVRDMALFRQRVNGRVFPHFFVYLLLIPPKAVFNVLNAAMATLLVILMGRYYKNNVLLTVCSIAAMWVFIPDFGQVFLWLTGSVNYLWGLVLFTVFIYPYYRRFTDSGGKVNVALMTLLGIICGAWSENGAAAALFVCAVMGLVIWVRERKLPADLFIPFIACFLGFVFLMMAPATAETRVGGDIMGNIWFIRVCLKDYCLWLFVAYAIILLAAIIMKVERKYIFVTLILVAAGLVSIIVFAFAAYLPARSFYILVTFLILSCLILLKEIKIKALVPVITVALVCIFAVKLYSGTQDIICLYNQSVERETLISAGDDDAVIPSYTAGTKYPAVYTEELSEDKSDWYNDLVAKYYGIKTVTKG